MKTNLFFVLDLSMEGRQGEGGGEESAAVMASGVCLGRTVQTKGTAGLQQHIQT